MFIIKRKTIGHMFLERRWLNKLAYSILSKAFEASNNNEWPFYTGAIHKY